MSWCGIRTRQGIPTSPALYLCHREISEMARTSAQLNLSVAPLRPQRPPINLLLQFQCRVSVLNYTRANYYCYTKYVIFFFFFFCCFCAKHVSKPTNISLCFPFQKHVWLFYKCSLIHTHIFLIHCRITALF